MIFRKDRLTVAALAAFIAFLLFLRALWGDFVNLDDLIFVKNNPYIRELNLELLAWAFSARALDLLIPFTWVSFAVDYRLWGLNPFGFHLTNILLHAANTALVAMIAFELATAISAGAAEGDGQTGQRKQCFLIALLAALIFGIHPLRVESVAWITERKDVLNGLFTLGSVYCYLLYCGKSATTGGKREYLLSLILFSCSLLAKPVSVGLPLLFLVIDWYPLQRVRLIGWRAVLREKVPFFVVSCIVGLVTIYLINQKQLFLGLARLSLADRCLLSGNALFEYGRMLLFPVGILPYYELPESVGISYLLKSLAVIAFALLCLLPARKRRWLLAGWLCFLLPVIPVLSFLQNNDIAYAARYTYLPSIGPSVLAAFGITALLSRLDRERRGLRNVMFAALLLLMLFYCGMTYRLTGVWHDTESLWTRVIELNPDTNKYMDRGVYYIINNRPEAAAADFSSAIEWFARSGKAPDHNAYAFRGLARFDLKMYEDAVADFSTALAIKPHPTYYFYRGLALQALGRNEEAEIDLELAGPNPPAIDTF